MGRRQEVFLGASRQGEKKVQYEHLPLVRNVKPFPSCRRSAQGFRPFPLHRQGMRAIFQIFPQETWWLRNNLVRQIQKLCSAERRISFETWKIHRTESCQSGVGEVALGL